jgi:hypothetical protein
VIPRVRELLAERAGEATQGSPQPAAASSSSV